MTYELGHLFLGQLGADKNRRIPERCGLSHEQEEMEAESVAYLIAKRNDIEAKFQTYLSGILEKKQILPPFDLYQVIRAAGQIESILGLKTISSGLA